MKKEEKAQASEAKVKKDRQAKQELHIRIERWQDLVDILDDKKKVYRLAVVTIIIGLTLFSGVTFIVLQLKKSFTYSDITTNALGATTLRDEQKEVAYFLFNTATIWANSGIEVEEGDVISVHSSGSAHTAIHHLDEAAINNRKPDEDYFDADGERFNTVSPRDRARRKYRIVPYLPNNALIMQVYSGNGRPPMKARTDGQRKNFYYVAQHRENIIIHESGTLYFAINDIVLDSTTIYKMKEDNYNYMLKNEENDPVLAKHHDLIQEIERKDVCRGKSDKKVLTKEAARLSEEKAAIYRECLKHAIYQFGPYYDEETHQTDHCTFKTEMDYYIEHKYRTAWFDDNVGSFLIVVEKNYRK